MFPAWLRDEGLGFDGDASGTAPQPFGSRAALPRPARSRRRGSVPPRTGDAARPGLPRGQRRGAAHGVAADPAAGLARRRRVRRGGRFGGVGGAGPRLAALLDVDAPVPGVTEGALRPEIAAIAVPTTVDGHNMADDDFALTVGWGHFGSGEAVMPGQGRADERPLTADERAALGEASGVLGETTFDVHLNGRAYWRNVPAAVWDYKLGGYQVLKKWLSSWDRTGRPEVLGDSVRTTSREALCVPEASRSLAVDRAPAGSSGRATH